MNLDNPAVAALLEAVRADDARAPQAVRLLKAFKGIIGRQGQGAAATALQQALGDFADTVRHLLGR